MRARQLVGHSSFSLSLIVDVLDGVDISVKEIKTLQIREEEMQFLFVKVT